MDGRQPHHVFACLTLLLIWAGGPASNASDPVRKTWETSRVKGTPDPPKPYVPEPAFPNLTFENGVEIVALNGRLFVMERSGKIWSFPEGDPTPEPALFGELKDSGHAFGIAFHPRWRDNQTAAPGPKMG